MKTLVKTITAVVGFMAACATSHAQTVLPQCTVNATCPAFYAPSVRLSQGGIVFPDGSTQSSASSGGGGSSTVTVNASLTGDGSSGTPLGVNSSSGTLRGNIFNVANRLVLLDGTGALPALNGANLFGVTAVAASSGAVGSVQFSSNGVLGGDPDRFNFTGAGAFNPGTLSLNEFAYSFPPAPILPIPAGTYGLRISGQMAIFAEGGNFPAYSSIGYAGIGGFFLGYGAGGSSGAPTQTTAGTPLGSLFGRGFDGTNWSAGSRGAVRVKATEAYTSSAQGTSITLETTPNGSTTRAVRATVDQSGNVGFGITAPVYRLDVSGDANVTGLYRIGGSQIASANLADGPLAPLSSTQAINGVVVSGVPSAGQAPIAVDATHATWQTPSSSAGTALMGSATNPGSFPSGDGYYAFGGTPTDRGVTPPERNSVFPSSGTIRRFYAKMHGTPNATASVDVALLVNNLEVTGTPFNFADTDPDGTVKASGVLSVAISDGDLVSFKVSENGAANSGCTFYISAGIQ